MTTSPEAKNIVKRLAEIQKELKVAKNQRNNFGNYNYRSCEDILEAVKPLLKGLALVVSDEIVHFPSSHPSHMVKSIDSKGNEVYELVDGDRFYVKATATIADGLETLSSTAYARESQNKKGMDDSQITGSSSSYARKYALNGLFAIDDTKDADSMDNNRHSNTESRTNHKPQNTPINTDVCEKCGTTIPPHRVEASMAKFNKKICYACETKGATV